MFENGDFFAANLKLLKFLHSVGKLEKFLNHENCKHLVCHGKSKYLQWLKEQDYTLDLSDLTGDTNYEVADWIKRNS